MDQPACVLAGGAGQRNCHHHAAGTRRMGMVRRSIGILETSYWPNCCVVYPVSPAAAVAVLSLRANRQIVWWNGILSVQRYARNLAAAVPARPGDEIVASAGRYEHAGTYGGHGCSYALSCCRG